MLHKNILAGFFGAFLEEQVNIFNQGLYLYAGTTHTFRELYPAAGGFVKITDAIFLAGDMGDKADAFVVADGIGR